MNMKLALLTRHREYFLSDDENKDEKSITIRRRLLTISFVFLLVSLAIVVLVPKTLSPTIERIIIGYDLPQTLVGVIIAAIILLPEGAAAVIPAKNNNLQTSLNLALGSALASIALTIPCVAVVCSIYDMEIILGPSILNPLFYWGFQYLL